MTVDKISKLAAKNIVPTEQLSLPETLLWYRLRDLYRSFSQDSISKENAAVEKQKIIKQYNDDKETFAFYNKYVSKSAQMWRNIESAARAYRENKTIENADKFVEAVYGVKVRSTPSKHDSERTENQSIAPRLKPGACGNEAASLD